jgi:hypothetical protein
MKGRLTNALFMHVKPFGTTTAPFKECDSSWRDVSMRALIQMKDF